MPLTDREQRVLDNVDADALVATVSELVAIRSLSGEESPAQEYVASFLDAAGIDVDVWEIDLAALSKHPHFSAEVERTRALGVVGATGRGDGPSLLLNGHVDVVPAGDPGDWTYPPWTPTVTADRIFGRGAVDMKGGLTCGMHALKAIVDAGAELTGRLMLASVVGEEDGGSGTLAMLEHGVHSDAAVVMEPTGLTLAPAQAGALSFRITVRGLSAHGATRSEGISAIEKFAPIHQALLALEQRRNTGVVNPAFAHLDRPFALCVGRLEAGDWPSSEADWLRAEGRYGVGPGEELDAARRELEDAVADVASGDRWLCDHPPTVEWVGGQFHPAEIPNDHELVRLVADAHAVVDGSRPPLHGMPYGSDMGKLVPVGGIPTVIYGPGDVRVAHRPDEYVPIDQLLSCTRVLALAGLRFCG
ncbi:MAG: ArgE/DapE family deacylase [Nitriliruptorales bacterium]|nr:ArgE/DapE family deacylase [Nitriliruptorales bacterium]